MKKIFLAFCSITVTALMFSACTKNEIKYIDTEPIENKALLKFNVNTAYPTNPAFQIEVNGKRVSNAITARTPYPGGGYNTGGGSTADYLIVDPGTVSINLDIPKKGTDVDSIQVYDTTISLEAGKNYTLHFTDTAANVKSLLVMDNVAIPADSTARYRFVHLMPNVGPVDLYHGTNKVVSALPYLSASDEFVINITGASNSFTVREAGVTATSLATYASANTILNRRAYTVFATGYKGLTDATRKPYVAFVLNK